ncbi:hypothetical protein LguiA_029023 [Lonicera macranthoides]
MATRALNLTRSILTTKQTLSLALSRSYATLSLSTPPPSSTFSIFRLRPLFAAATSLRHESPLAASLRGFATRQTMSSLKDSSPNGSNRPPKETILLDGCDFEHWLVVMEKPEGDPTRDDIIDSYIKTLAQVVGSEDEARMKIYSVSTKHYFAFGALVSEEVSYKIKELPKVRWVLPDSYLDVRNKDYGGEPFINGQAVPYDPKYHEEWVRNNARATEKNRRNERHRNFDRSRNFERRRENMQQNRGPNTGGPPPRIGGGPPNMGGGPPPQGNMGGRMPPPGNMGGGMPPQDNMDGPLPQGNMGGGGGMPPPGNMGGGIPPQGNMGGGMPPPGNMGGPPRPNNMGGAPPPSYGGAPPPNYGGGPPNPRSMQHGGPPPNYGKPYNQQGPGNCSSINGCNEKRRNFDRSRNFERRRENMQQNRGPNTGGPPPRIGGGPPNMGGGPPPQGNMGGRMPPPGNMGGGMPPQDNMDGPLPQGNMGGGGGMPPPGNMGGGIPPQGNMGGGMPPPGNMGGPPRPNNMGGAPPPSYGGAPPPNYGGGPPNPSSMQHGGPPPNYGKPYNQQGPGYDQNAPPPNMARGNPYQTQNIPGRDNY